jgi:hypothetical protein
MYDRHEPTADDVGAAVEHVCYELEMMVRQLDEAERARTSGRVEQYIVNALFEAGVLHARNLIEFLTFKVKSKSTKMHPVDFGATRGTLRDPSYDNLVNLHLSHLLWERVTEPLGVWPDLGPLVEDLLGLFEDFVLSTPHRALFEPCLREAREVWGTPTGGSRAGLAQMTTSSTVTTAAGVRICEPPNS